MREMRKNNKLILKLCAVVLVVLFALHILTGNKNLVNLDDAAAANAPAAPVVADVIPR